jgi:hypothetical protein
MKLSRACTISLLCASAALTAVPGCSAPRSAATGTVSFKGKPLAMGTVFMVGADGIAVPAVINPDGTYRIEGVANGLAKISVSSPKPATPEMIARARKGRPPANPPPAQDVANWFEIPEKFADPQTSGLTVELKGGENLHDIVLP